MDVITAIIRQRKFIAGSVILMSSIAVVVSFMLTPQFRATAKIMPPQQQGSSASALLGQLGMLSGAVGGIAGLKNPNDLYVGILQSQTIADSLIKKLKLRERFESVTLTSARKTLDSLTDVSSGKDGLISISVESDDPNFSAKLANAYVIELTEIMRRIAVTDAAKRRLFFEKQLESAKEKLAAAELALKKTQEKTGLLQVDSQISAIVANVAQLKAAISSREVQLESMRAFATNANPDLQKLQLEIQSLKGQLAKLEKDNPQASDLMVPTSRLPESGLDYLRRLREVKYQESMFEMLAKQFELARIDEARDSSLIQVLDVATVPDQKSKPQRALICITGAALGLLIGFFLAIVREFNSRAAANNRPSPWSVIVQTWRSS